MLKKLLLMTLLFSVLIGCSSNKTKEQEPVAQQWIGQWSGDIAIPQSPLPVIIELTADGGSFSVPAQGLHQFPINSISYKEDSVTIQMDLNGSKIKIEGVLRDGKIDSTFIQNGQSFPLVLSPYEQEEVTYEQLNVPVKGGELAIAFQPATIQNDHTPLAIIIAGSGPTDKNGNSVGGTNNSLKMLAEGLAEKGIASVRYDKRGVGENTTLIAKEEDLSIDQYADDVVQIIKEMMASGQFSTVHIIGHSEGSLVGMLAAQQANINSFTSIAGAGRPIDQVLLEQLSSQLPEALLTESKEIIEALKTGEQVTKISAELQALFRLSVQPYMISWLSRDPAQLIQKIDQPILIVQGKHDIQVTEVDAEALHDAKTDAQLVYIDTMNHVLKDSPADRAANIATYGNSTLPLHVDLLPVISSFIVEANK